MTWNKRSVPLICLTTSSLPAQNFASVTRRVSDDERSVLTGTRVSEERAATQSMAQKASRSKAEVCKTPVPQFKSGCRLQKNRVHQDSVFIFACLYLNLFLGKKLPYCHTFSVRRCSPFVPCQCSAIPQCSSLWRYHILPFLPP